MLPGSAFTRALREAAPALSKRFFDCSGRRHGSALHGAQPLYLNFSNRVPATLHSRTLDEKSIASIQRRIPVNAKRASIPYRSTHAYTSHRITRTFSASAETRATQTAEESTGPSAEHSSKDGTKDEEGHKKKSWFPETSSKVVAYWLLGSAASVFGIVVFGGLTRLTESGYVYVFCPFHGWIEWSNADMALLARTA